MENIKSGKEALKEMMSSKSLVEVLKDEILEEIVWKDGKFQNKEEKVVKPEPIGEPISINSDWDFIGMQNEKAVHLNALAMIYELRRIREKKEYLSVNCYSRSRLPWDKKREEEYYYDLCMAIQFYKI